MDKQLVKSMVYGLVLGLIIGSMGFIGYSYATGYSVFGVQWRPIKTYYMRIDLEYVYLHYYNVSSNTPLLGGRTLLEYIVIVRVENPYRGLVVVPRTVRIGLYESLSVTNNSGQNITVTVIESRNGDTTAGVNNSTVGYEVFFDSYKALKTVSYMATNDLLLGAGRLVISGDLANDWLCGGDRIGERKYYVIRGVVELPYYGMKRLRGNDTSYYFVVEFDGKIHDKNDRAVGELIGFVKLVKTGPCTYVFNRINYGSGFVLEGDTLETFFGEIWP